MRILHVASGREWRGGQRQTWLLACGLASRGVAQKILTRRGSDLALRASQNGIAVVPVRWSAGLDPRALATLVLAARHADLLHAHDSHAVSLAAAAAALTGRPFVATRRMTRPLQIAGPWRRAAGVIAISDAVRDALLASGIPGDSIALVHPGIDVEATRRTRPVSWKDLASIPPPDGAFVVVAVSALTEEKGIDLLIDAVADPEVAGAGVYCVIAGQGPEGTRLSLRASAQRPAGRVQLLGQVADPLPLIAAAGALVMPSREEAFGSTILDALALGVPVIAAAVGGIPEALRHGGGVTFPPGDRAALAREIARLSRDRDRRATLALEGPKAAGHFDLPGMVDRTVAVYRSVMERVERQ